MLVLSRKVQECIIIGNNIRVVLIEVARGRVKIGIEAPPELEVWREEIPLKERIRRK